MHGPAGDLLPEKVYWRSEDFEYQCNNENGFCRLCSRTMIFLERGVQEKEEKKGIRY